VKVIGLYLDSSNLSQPNCHVGFNTSAELLSCVDQTVPDLYSCSLPNCVKIPANYSFRTTKALQIYQMRAQESEDFWGIFFVGYVQVGWLSANRLD
jgi:hypothetical protein